MALPPPAQPAPSILGRRTRAVLAGAILAIALATMLGNFTVQRSDACAVTDSPQEGASCTSREGTYETRSPSDTADSELTPAKAILLGVIEGVTEFLPISSTGHLLVAEDLLGVGDSEETKDAADSYAIAIQSGAILAVVVLYRRRVWSMVEGAVGRDKDGRTVLLSVILAFVPAVVIALIFERPIKDNLLGPGPVAFAWFAGGVAILLLAKRWTSETGGRALEQMTLKQAAIIGVAQCIAMWPGTSRSMITILAALFLGMSLAAAVEFSFLLGLVTLGAATAYELLKNGQLMLDTFGWVDPIIGLVAAFISALIAIKWMVDYLQKHSLAIFGWYRIAIAAGTAVLLLTGTI